MLQCMPMTLFKKFGKITVKKAAFLIAAVFAPFPGAVPSAIAIILAKDAIEKNKAQKDEDDNLTKDL